MRATLLLLTATALGAAACGLQPDRGLLAERAQQGAQLRAREALERQDYARAIEHADRALRFRPPARATEAELALIKAEALDGLDRPGEAALLYRYVASLHGGSDPGVRAERALEDLAARGVDVRPGPAGASSRPPLTRLQTSRLLVDREWLEAPVEIFYPYRAEADDLEGIVEVRLHSDGRGGLASHEVLYASHPLFEDAVLRALPGFRFVPERMASSEPPYTRIVRFRFRLRGG